MVDSMLSHPNPRVRDDPYSLRSFEYDVPGLVTDLSFYFSITHAEVTTITQL